MAAMRMVHLTTASGPFHARVIAARLGAEGILTELRGGPGVTYPLGGTVEVMVTEEDADAARQLLAADEAEADMAVRVDVALGAPTAARLHSPARERWLIWLALAAAVVIVLVGFAGHALG